MVRVPVRVLLLLIRRRAVRLLLLLGRGLLLMVLRVALGLLVLPSLIVPRRRARVEPAPTIVPVLAGVPSRGRGVLPVAPAPPPYSYSRAGGWWYPPPSRPWDRRPGA